MSLQAESSRDEFLAAAFAVFAEKGFHGASIDDIVLKAGRSKGGFYHHFESKDQLYLEMIDQVLRRADDMLKEGLRSGEPVREILMRLLVNTGHIMNDTKHMKAGAEFFLLALRNPEVNKVFRYIHQKSVDMFAEFFQKAIDRGEFRGEFTAREMSETVFASSRGIVIVSTVLEDGRLNESLKKFVEIQIRAFEART